MCAMAHIDHGYRKQLLAGTLSHEQGSTCSNGATRCQTRAGQRVNTTPQQSSITARSKTAESACPPQRKETERGPLIVFPEDPYAFSNKPGSPKLLGWGWIPPHLASMRHRSRIQMFSAGLATAACIWQRGRRACKRGWHPRLQLNFFTPPREPQRVLDSSPGIPSLQDPPRFPRHLATPFFSCYQKKNNSIRP